MVSWSVSSQKLRRQGSKDMSADVPVAVRQDLLEDVEIDDNVAARK